MQIYDDSNTFDWRIFSSFLAFSASPTWHQLVYFLLKVLGIWVELQKTSGFESWNPFVPFTNVTSPQPQYFHWSYSKIPKNVQQKCQNTIFCRESPWFWEFYPPPFFQGADNSAQTTNTVGRRFTITSLSSRDVGLWELVVGWDLWRCGKSGRIFLTMGWIGSFWRILVVHQYDDLWWWFQIILGIFTHTWGRWTHFDEHIFQMCWNHQLDDDFKKGEFLEPFPVRQMKV